jgi:hypothetical protein
MCEVRSAVRRSQSIVRMEDHLIDLRKALSERRALLFVGAGISMSVGMPSWRTLIEHMLNELELDASILESPDITYQTIAEYFKVTRGSLQELGEWMKARWRVSDEEIRSSRLHELIVSLDFPTIYTTNCDANLENAYRVHGRPYKKVTNARDLAHASPEVTLIIKYHGDFEDMASLVIAETDYFERLSFEAPLDIRFRSDSLAATMLFVGYSMSDLNIRFLLYRLWSTWHRAGSANHRPNSYVFMHRPTEVQRSVLKQWGVTILEGSGDSAESSLLKFLEELDETTTSALV